MQKNSGGGEDLIRGGDIFYLGGCTPPCTPPENPPMDERPLELLSWKGVEVEGLVERGEERVVAWKWAALS